MRLNTEIAEDLAQLSIGDRFWFWLCLSLPSDESPLRVTSFKHDPRKARLEELAAGAEVNESAAIYRGLGVVLDDGHLSFGGPGLTLDLLERFALWVQTNVVDTPALAILTDTVFLDIGPDGAVKSEHHDPDFWGLSARFDQPS
ncbi:MAG: hypothetical protein AAGG48_29935 [Planctomycetota bacterium]